MHLLPQQPRRRHLLDIPHTTQQLNAIEGGLGGALGSIQDSPSAVLGADEALLIDRLGRSVRVGARGLQLRVHVGELALDELVAGDGLPELLPLVRERQRHVERRLHEAEGSGAEHQALEVQALHQHPHAAVDAAQDVLARDEHAVEYQLPRVAAPHPHLVELARAAEPFRRPRLHDERRDALGPGLRLRLRVHDDDVGVWPVRDPHLGAVEDVPAIDLLGRRPHAHDVAAGTRFGHGQGPDLGSRDEARQVPLLLVGVAVELQLVDAQLRVGGVAEADAAASPGQLLHDDAVGLVAQRQPAHLLVRRHPKEPGLPQLRPHLTWERVAAVCRRRHLLWDLAPRELLHALAQLLQVRG